VDSNAEQEQLITLMSERVDYIRKEFNATYLDVIGVLELLQMKLYTEMMEEVEEG